MIVHPVCGQRCRREDGDIVQIGLVPESAGEEEQGESWRHLPKQIQVQKVIK